VSGPTTAAATGGAREADAEREREREREARIAAARTGMTLAHWAARQPDRPAFVSPHGDRTFAELNAEANRLARALRRRGVRPGDAVAAMIPNRVEFATVLMAALRTGLRFTPINWHLTADEAAYIVDNCEARAFVADRRFAAVAAGAARQAPGATVRLGVGGEAGGSGGSGGSEASGGIDGFDPYDEVVGAEEGHDLEDPVLGGTMPYTSGTTGRPKGVHRPPVQPGVRTVLPSFGYRAGESLHLCTGPLYHTAPLAFSLSGPLAAGAGVVCMDGWSPTETLGLIEQHRITHTHMVPTMFHRLLSLPDAVREAADVSSLRLVVHGAAPCPVATKRAMIEWFGPVLLEYYAATEGTGTFVGSEEWLRKPGTVGKPADPDHVRVLGAGGEPVPAGEVGTVYLRAPASGRFRYFKDPGKTESSYQGDHFTMGDVGYLDEDGYLFLTDRSADLIISGGVNIYPAEVEAALLTHTAVGDAAVIGVPDDEWGESVLAVIEPQPGVEPSDELAADLIDHCRELLAHFKCPKQVDFVDRLPRTDSGKLYKRRLRDEYRARARAAATADPEGRTA
jgi:long-chain acyl-CoA synthetase